MGNREQFFACVFVSDRNEYQFHFRAWDAAEAEYTFREALRADGLAEPGTLEIRDAKGKVLRQGPFLPTSAGQDRLAEAGLRRSVG